jgi:glycogen(starch) synthase
LYYRLRDFQKGDSIKVLMFGWEFPPFNSGGLGTACLGLTESLSPLGVEIDFVIPKSFGVFPYDHMRFLSATDYISTEEILSLLHLSAEDQGIISKSLGYGNSLAIDDQKRIQIQHRSQPVAVSPHQQATWYAYQGASIALENEYEVIHCHDWMTYFAGIAAKQVAASKGLDIPFIAHVHATEIDRAGGGNGHPGIMAIEKAGLEAADRVIAVSDYTKQIIHKHYGIPLKKITIVHNGLSSLKAPRRFDLAELKKHHKVVLFMGRITLSKGPDYFIKLATKVTAQDPSVKFVMVGSGDKERECIEAAAAAGLTGKILFSSFLRGTDVDRAYQLADLFVMPSVSEPFGLVALEAIHNGTPVIISKQSGVSEVSDNMVKVDFWDVEAMSKAVIHLLHHPEAAARLAQAGKNDLPNITWKKSAEKIRAIYQEELRTSLAPVPSLSA